MDQDVVLELTAAEIRARLKAGDRVGIWSSLGHHSPVLRVEDASTQCRIIFRGAFTGVECVKSMGPKSTIKVVTRSQEEVRGQATQNEKDSRD